MRLTASWVRAVPAALTRSRHCRLAWGLGSAISAEACLFPQENYYQEAGRAGRDGRQADCLLLYRFGDALRLAGLICYELTWADQLRSILAYATSEATCRRALICRHFLSLTCECVLALCS